MGIFGQALATTSGQIALVFLGIMVEREHIDLSIPPDLIHAI
jgi:hypothetical protein